MLSQSKEFILSLRQAWKTGDLSLSEGISIAIEDAYVIRATSKLSPVVQLRHRANSIAFPLTAAWLDFVEFAEKNGGVER